MKKKQKEKAKEVSLTILKALGLVGVVASVMIFPGLAAVVQMLERETRRDTRQIRNSLYGMRKRKIIEFKSTSKGIKLILTPKGKKRLAQVSLYKLSLDKSKKWDGKWRLVMFDIPESHRDSRDLIRSHLHRLGFEQVHKSVFITPYPCAEAIELMRNYYALPAGAMYVFESTVLDGEAELKKIFRL